MLTKDYRINTLFKHETVNKILKNRTKHFNWYFSGPWKALGMSDGPWWRTRQNRWCSSSPPLPTPRHHRTHGGIKLCISTVATSSSGLLQPRQCCPGLCVKTRDNCSYLGKLCCIRFAEIMSLSWGRSVRRDARFMGSKTHTSYLELFTLVRYQLFATNV